MKRIYQTLFCTLILFNSFSQVYTISTGLPNNLISGSGTTISNSGLGDDNFLGPFNIGFNFTFFNTTQTQFYMSSNGYITFGSGSSSTSVGTIPNSSTPNNFIAYAATDQYTGASSSPIINYFISGISPNRILVVNYQNIRHYNSSGGITSIQLQLFEGNGQIEIHNIQNISYNGISRTIGIENSTGSTGFSPADMNNSTSISLNNQMIRFSTCSPPPAPIISPSSVPILCASNPTVSLTATCAIGSLSWSNGATTTAIEVSPTTTTTYTATCTDNGCQTSSNISVPVLQIPSVLPNGTNYICTGNTLTLTASSTTAGVGFQWYKDGSSVNNLTNSIVVNQSGSYQVMIAKNGCSAISLATFVNVNSTIPPAPTFSKDTVIVCYASTVQLVANGCANGLITWSNGFTGSSFSYTHTNINSPVFFTTTCKIDGCTSIVSRNINMITANSNILNSPREYICAGGIITLIGNTKTGATYQWEKDYSIISGETASTLQITTTGRYSLKTNYYSNCFEYSPPVLVQLTSILPITAAFASSTKDTLFKVWDKVYGRSTPSQMLKTNDGNYMLFGTISVSSDDFWVIKINPSGNLIWQKNYGGSSSEYSSKILKTNDNGYLLIGRTESGVGYDKSEPSLGGWDIWVIKIDENGNKIWDKTIGTAINDDIRDAIMLSDGSFMIVGPSRSLDNNNEDYQIFKINSIGTTIWQKLFTGNAYDSPTRIIQTNDNGFIINGGSNSGIANDKTAASKGGYDYWLIKIDANGNKVWDKTFGGSGSETGTDIVKTSDNYYYLNGTSNSGISVDKSENSKGWNDYWVIKINENGDKIWDKSLGGNTSENPQSAILSNDGGIILGGNTYSDKSGDITEDPIGSNSDIWLVKLNEFGSKVWNKRIGGNKIDYLSNFYLEDDNLFILGSSDSNISGDKTFPSWNNANCQSNFSCINDIWLLKYILKNPLTSPATINQGQTITLVASNCQGNVLWSNGMSGAIISVSPVGTTTYTATCSAFGCSTNSVITVNVNPCGQIVSLTETENVLTGTPIAPVIFKAQDTINAINIVGQPPINAAARYAAGKSINLNPGFKVEVGSIFQANISATPCNE